MSLGRVSRLLKGSLSWSVLRPGVAVSGQVSVVSGQRRELSHVPVDDLISGLSEEQIQVLNLATKACLPSNKGMSLVGV